MWYTLLAEKFDGKKSDEIFIWLFGSAFCLLLGWSKPGPFPDCDFALCRIKGPEIAVCFYGWAFNFGFELF